MAKETESVRRLDAEFEKSGRKFKKVYEDDRWYVYAVWTGSRKSPMYEVFKKVIRPEAKFDTELKHIVRAEGLFREAYPNDNAFGVGAPFYAFDCISMERCRERMLKVDEYEAGHRVNWH